MSKNYLLILYSSNTWSVFIAFAYVPGAIIISRDMNVPVWAIQSSIALYLLTYATTQILSVIFLGERKPERAIASGIAMACIGTGICALANDFGAFMLGRCLQAIGAAVTVLNIRVTAQLLDTRRDGTVFIATLFILSSLGLLLGPLAAGGLVTLGGWRTIFVVLLLWGIANAVFQVSLSANAPRSNETNICQAWGGEQVRGFLVCLQTRAVILPVALNAASYWAFYGFAAGLPVVVSGLEREDPRLIGLLAAFSGVGAILGGLGARRLARTWQAERILSLGLCLTMGPLLLIPLIRLGSSEVTIAGLMLLGLFVGGTTGFVQPTALISVMTIPGVRPITATALIGSIQILGGSIASMVIPYLGKSPSVFAITLFSMIWVSGVLWIRLRPRVV